ncbi:hypothetical protein EVAR_23995_1 [Eumeta japonica]|uniref:Uncharacterized protein n=1 Tax=Eumeta variegata TaxID=151549 RepID=A0A4C1WC89_EUMVA|nr:hypothetical protein EVAR_23995_1 [Eumeta japonica]
MLWSAWQSMWMGRLDGQIQDTTSYTQPLIESDLKLRQAGGRAKLDFTSAAPRRPGRLGSHVYDFYREIAVRDNVALNGKTFIPARERRPCQPPPIVHAQLGRAHASPERGVFIRIPVRSGGCSSRATG